MLLSDVTQHHIIQLPVNSWFLQNDWTGFVKNGFNIPIYQTWEFSRLGSWSRDVSRPVFTSLGLGLGLEPRSLGLGTYLLLVTCRCWAVEARCFKCPTRYTDRAGSWTCSQSQPWRLTPVACSNVWPPIGWKSFSQFQSASSGVEFQLIIIMIVGQTDNSSGIGLYSLGCWLK